MPRAFIITTELDRARALELIGKLNLSVPWAVTWRRHKSKRTLDQNSLYWAWLAEIANETGHTANELHEVFRIKFLPPSIVVIGSATYEVRPSTTKLNTKEMSDYMTQIEALAASMGIILPHPEDLGREIT